MSLSTRLWRVLSCSGVLQSEATVGGRRVRGEAKRRADATEDRIEQQAEANAAAAGDAVAALGLTERQLLDADLRAADGTELGDIAQVQRDATGGVTGLLVEIENSNPDRYVVVPLAGLTTRPDGTGTDVQTSMTAAQLAALPDTPLAAAPAPR